ncbi:TonB-dependent receptor [Terricaulis silvestris]|uniref:Pesticin receptor n=1 Tax=Terricaulis silvestris TaxID=2686094 RepID=A0A6I6ML53_9CAUL|nr:TonB-dependent receptor [Terricaulis silvestris]QGZ93694.1 Pesticin receptor [Terricaulis silvestris]
MKGNSKKARWAASASVLAGSLFMATAPAAFAQDTPAAQADDGTVDDIIVTAQRRSERLQDVPIAVTPVTAELLENAGVAGTLDLQAVVPGLRTYQIGSALTPFIRGVGSTQSSAGFESSIAVYLDGVYIGNKSSNVFDLANIDRIEVLRGPQGTLFGRNATGGAVNILTRNPGSGPEFEASVGAGDMGERSFSIYGGAPLGDTLSANFAVNGREHDGWIYNPVRQTNQNPHESWSLAGVVLWEPSDNLTVRLSGNQTYYDEATFLSARPEPGTLSVAGSSGFVVPGERESSSDHETTARQEAWNLGLNVTYELPAFTFVSITGYGEGQAATLSDSDFSNATIAYSGAFGIGEQFTQEFQLQSPDNDSPLSWIVGAHYMQFDEGVGNPGENFISAAGVPSPIRPQDLTNAGYCASGAYCVNGIVAMGTTESWALFGQGTYDFTEATSLTLGVRYGEESHSVDGYSFRYRAVAGTVSDPVYNGVLGAPGLVFDTSLINSTVSAAQDFDATTYRIALDHNFTDTIMGYVSYNTGFKSGAFNQTTLSTTAVDPEELAAWEVGLKTQWFGNRLRLNGAYWSYEYSDIQVGLITGFGITTVQNAAEASLQGIDIDFEWRATEALSFTGGFTWLESEYDDYGAGQIFLPRTTVNTSCPVPVGGVGITMAEARTRAAGTPIGGNYSCAVDAGGESLIFAPEFSGNVTVDYDIPLANESRLALSSTLSYVSSYTVSPGGIFAEIPSFETLAASVTYHAPNDAWFLRAWGVNLTDDLHPIYISPQAQGFQYVENRPVTYGVTFGVNFGGP